jgi:hypothetical protein
MSFTKKNGRCRQLYTSRCRLLYMTYYRIQDADRDPNELLDPEQQWSSNWGGNGDPRSGISVCGTEHALTRYFAARAIDCGYDAEWMSGLVVVEVDGPLSDEDDEDAADGALLVLPTRIVSVRPLPQDMIAEICG